METLDLNNKRKREKLTASEWNSLIDAINLLILRYNLEATIPTKLSQLINDAGFITDISGKADKSDLARVATTGSYNDLKDKPDLSNIGSAGKSAYELAVENGYQGTIQLWLLSLKGQDGTNGTNGQDGTNGNDGITPHIDPTSKHWMIGETDTGVLAEGQNGQNGQDGLNGKNGTDGTDGITPHIDQTTGNWFIGNTNTGVHAQGPLGIQGETGALGSQGILGIQGPLGPTGTDGITPTISVTNISGGHNVAFNYGSGDSRNANFNVMDGSLADLVQADWNQSDNTQPDYVKNKPDIYTKEEIDNLFTGYDYVEIGGIKWATMNVGAKSVTDYGLYFQWGDAKGYKYNQIGWGRKYFNWDNYKYTTDSSSTPTPTKYNYSTDNKRVLDLSDDGARAYMGGSWRMPTREDFLALKDAVTTEYVTNYQESGVAGLVCTDKTDSSKVLFFPAAGKAWDGDVVYRNSYGMYWGSNLGPNSDSLSGDLLVFYNEGSVNWNSDNNRCFGYSVRGVLSEPTIPLIWRGTLSEYDALSPNYDSNTIYIIT